MKRTKRDIWSERVRRWQASGEDAQTFATREGCNASTLKGWRWKLGMSRPARSARCRDVAVPQRAQFVEFVAPALVGAASPRPAARAFEITLAGGDRVVVPPDFDARSLEALLSALSGAR